MRSHVSRAVTDTHLLSNAAAVRAEADPYNHHSAVRGRQEETSAPFSRNSTAHTGGATLPHPPYTLSYPGYYVIPTLATSAAAAAGAFAGAEVRPEVSGTAAGPASQVGRLSTAARAALHPPMRLSAAATAFSMPAGAMGSPDQLHETSTVGGSGDSGSNAVEEDHARRQRWSQEWTNPFQEHAREAERRRGLVIGRERRAGGSVIAAGAAARARGDHPVPVPVPNPDGSWAFAQVERLAQAGLGFAHGGRLQHGDRGPYLEVVPLTRMAELPPEPGTVAPADGGTASTAGGSNGDGAVTRMIADGQGQSQSHLAALPAFRHWESQRARLRLQVRGLRFGWGADAPFSGGFFNNARMLRTVA